MRAPSVIIVTSGFANEPGPTALDQLLQFVLSLGKRPIVVLGPDGDEFLMNCPLIDQAEIVFDPNFSGGLFSGVKAGLYMTKQPVFVLSLSSHCPDRSGWERLEKELLSESASQLEILSLAAQEAGGSWNSGLTSMTGSSCATPKGPPLRLITPRGIRSLLQLDAETDWERSESVVPHLIPWNPGPSTHL